MIGRFFRVPKHNKFEYRPRHFDPEKEERENRWSSKSGEGDVEAVKKRIRSKMRKGYIDTNSYLKTINRSSNYKLVAIILVICIVAYIFIQYYLSDFLDKILG